MRDAHPGSAAESLIRPRIGISSCLLGEQVRYDGGHKHEPWIMGALAAFVDLIDTCPEVEIGLGTPRPPIRLERHAGGTRLVSPNGDLTEQMRAFADARAQQLLAGGLDGYVLKSRSPSCGLERVPVWNDAGQPERTGRGLFAERLVANAPTLAVEEEGRLRDAALRDRFLAKTWFAARLRAQLHTPMTTARLQALHRREKFLLLAFDPERYRALGRLVAATTDPDATARVYAVEAAIAFDRIGSVGRHVNTLQHAAGMIRERLDDGDRAELAELIERYRSGRLPRAAVTTLLVHHARRLSGWGPAEWLAEQTYLDPYPAELQA